jgi:PAS domain S-box-containing protein
VDILTNRQRAAAWLATWNPSFVGKAIVSRDFKFQAVNDQFCEILGVTPAVLLEHSFEDITAPQDQKLDTDNAELVIKGKSPGYLMEKSYQFRDNHEVKVLLMVVGVYKEDGNFYFFTSRIVEAPTKTSVDSTPSPKTLSWLAWMTKAWKILTVLVPVAAWVAYEVLKLLKDGENITLPPLP